MRSRSGRHSLNLCVSLALFTVTAAALALAQQSISKPPEISSLSTGSSTKGSQASSSPLRKSASSADSFSPTAEEDFLSPPKVGYHRLRILSPTILELCLVTTKKPDGPVERWNFIAEDGTPRLPAPNQFRILIGSGGNTLTPRPPLPKLRERGSNALTSVRSPRLGRVEEGVQAVGFKRRVLYAPLKKRDLRIGNYLYLRLATPIPDDSTMEVQNPDGTLWNAAERYIARADAGRWNPAIHVNQVGYMPQSAKKAMVGYYLGSLGELELPAGSRFSLIDDKTGRAVYSGELKPRIDRGWTYATQPYQHVLEADFSAFRTPGEYRLSVPGMGASLPFRIDEGTAAVFARAYALGLYHQRCGTENALPFTRFVHAPCHTAPAEVPTMENKSVQRQLAGESSNYKDNPRHTAPQLKDVNSSLYPFVRQGKVDVSGGHHDAGDYSKYTINSAQLIHSLIFAVDNFPGVGSLDNLGLPESGDGKSDLLQIAKWEADFLAKMQDDDGGFYFLVYPRGRAYENDVLPDAGDPQVVFPKTTSVTAAAVAALAQTASSPQFKKNFPEAAALYLRKARKGWEFLERAWAKYGMDGSYQKITHYGDVFMHDDEIAWAATELYLATGERKYHDRLLRMFDPSDKNTRHWTWERMFEAYGCAIRSYAFAESSGRVTRQKQNPVFLEKCRREILAAAKDHQDWADANAYGTSFPIESKRFRAAGWYFSTSQAFDIAVADLIEPRPERMEAIWGNLNFEAGCNPNNVVFLTGVGWKRQTEIVHQYAMNDRRALPPSGIPLGSIQEGFMYLDAYKKELGAISFPPDGKQDSPYPFYDRWGDSFNVATEFTIPIQGRCLAVTAWLMAQSSLKTQRWRTAEARIAGVPDHVKVGKPMEVTLKVEGMSPKDAVIVWEGQGHEPRFGTSFNYRPERAGKQWIEAEAHWPDGRRACAALEFNAE